MAGAKPSGDSIQDINRGRSAEKAYHMAQGQTRFRRGNVSCEKTKAQYESRQTSLPEIGLTGAASIHTVVYGYSVSQEGRLARFCVAQSCRQQMPAFQGPMGKI